MITCSICLYTGQGLDLEEPVVVKNGHSVCASHAGYSSGGSHASVLAAVVRHSGFKTLGEVQAASARDRESVEYLPTETGGGG